MKRFGWRWPVGAAACGLAVLHIASPAYLLHQGFPLDDAWIHAVYAREVARSATLAYNPGVPATGETAPLWAVLLGIIHLISGSPSAFVAVAKFFGFAVHVGASVTLGLALRKVVPERGAWLAAALVAVHPDLIAASVSGMEVPMATFIVSAVVGATVRRRRSWLVIIGALAIAVRPETAAIAALFPIVFWLPASRRDALMLSVSALCGSGLGLALLGLRNEAVSGMVLPATFHAKVHGGSLLSLQSQLAGFGFLLGHVPLMGPLVLLALVIALGALFFRTNTNGWGPDQRVMSALYLVGMVFCGLSFALVPPVDPAAFYHQRYILPALPLLVGLGPLLLAQIAATWPSYVLTATTRVITAGLFLVLLVGSPSRAVRLSNDARNIDDVQVALGRSLASAASSDVFWTIDAGASRYFGQPFVVDLIGLNSPALLTTGAQQFLDAHEPNFIEQFPRWSTIDRGSTTMPARAFQTSTPYTVTSFPEMNKQILVTCAPPAHAGELEVRGQHYGFRCAPDRSPGG